jgi:hypothetical protein
MASARIGDRGNYQVLRTITDARLQKIAGIWRSSAVVSRAEEESRFLPFGKLRVGMTIDVC